MLYNSLVPLFSTPEYLNQGVSGGLNLNDNVSPTSWLATSSFPMFLKEKFAVDEAHPPVLNQQRESQRPGHADPLTGPIWPHSWSSSHVSMSQGVPCPPLTANTSLSQEK